MRNPEAKAKWLKDLRSGEFKQGIGYLRTMKDEYCCLGILCTQAKGKWIESRYNDGDGTPRFFTFIPEGGVDNGSHLVRWLGALATVYDITEEQESTLAHMNDEGKSFAEIADWIEANL